MKKVQDNASTTAVAATTASSKHETSNIERLVLVILFIATAPSLSEDAKTLMAAIMKAISKIPMFKLAISALETQELLKENTLTTKGRALATRSLSASFEVQKGINAAEVAKGSTPSYLFTIGATFVTEAFKKFNGLETFKPNEGFLYGSEKRPGAISFFETTFNQMEEWELTDEVIETVLPEYKLVKQEA